MDLFLFDDSTALEVPSDTIDFADPPHMGGSIDESTLPIVSGESAWLDPGEDDVHQEMQEVEAFKDASDALGDAFLQTERVTDFVLDALKGMEDELDDAAMRTDYSKQFGKETVRLLNVTAQNAENIADFAVVADIESFKRNTPWAWSGNEYVPMDHHGVDPAEFQVVMANYRTELAEEVIRELTSLKNALGIAQAILTDVAPDLAVLERFVEMEIEKITTLHLDLQAKQAIALA